MMSVGMTARVMPASSSTQLLPNVPVYLSRLRGAVCSPGKVRKTSANSSSFQQARNVKVAATTTDGSDTGMMTRRIIWNVVQPSRMAASSSSFGSWRK
jgi:hypothetical protein